MPELDVEVAGVELESPFVLASGVWGESGASLARALRAGAAAVVIKCVCLEPRPGYPNPTVVELPLGLVNAMGLPNPGVEAYGEEIAEALKPGKPVIGSIFGRSPSEFCAVAKKMEGFGVHALELNLSCPHVRGAGAELGRSPLLTEKITRAVKGAVEVPVFVKLTPNTASIASLAKAAERGGADGVTAINTIRAMVINLELSRPVLSNEFGGLSGPAIKPVGIRAVYEIFEAVRIPIFGVGGVSSGEDAAEYIMAGARAVQVGTAVYKEREQTFRQLRRHLSRLMTRLGYESIEEMVGRAHGGR
ncbi:MAG: dihydroorotate dehydrogenase [Thermoplasmata archaeon]